MDVYGVTTFYCKADVYRAFFCSPFIDDCAVATRFRVRLKTQSLKKHVGAIQVSGRLSLLERKIANVLLLNAYDNLLTADEHSIRLRDLADSAGFNSKDEALLKNAFRKLAKTTVEWNILSAEGDEDWTVATLLSRATIRKGRGVCCYAYDSALRKKLYHPDMYARINLAVQRRFNSGYALVLYENCARFRNVHTTGWINVADWRKLFGVKPSQYKLFKDFSKRVLKPAITEVNKESDLRVAADYRRENRSITQIRFGIADAPKTGQGGVLDSTHDAEISPLFARLRSLGISDKKTAKLISAWAEEHIQRNLDYVEQELKLGKAIKKPGAYTIKAIEENFAASVDAFASGVAARAEMDLKKKAHLNAAKRAQTAEANRKSDLLQKAFDALPENEKQRRYRRALAELEPNDVIAREYRKKGADSLLFRWHVLTQFKLENVKVEQTTN